MLLDLKRAAQLKRYLELTDDEVSARVREVIATYGAGQMGEIPLICSLKGLWLFLE